MDRGRLSRTYQQHIFDGCQPAVCRQNWPRCPRRLDVGRSHPDTRLGVGRGTIGRRRRGRHRISPVGRFLLGASLLRSFRKVDRHARPRLACRRCCALGHPDLVARMVRAGALISVLAADLHVTAALLDRLSGPSLVGVHVPLFFWLRRSPSERRALQGRAFLQIWSLAAIAGILLLGTSAFFAAYDRELPWIGRDPTIDQTFIRHMLTHHEQGILLAEIAAEKASDPHLRALSKLMIASQRGEARILSYWWASWFVEPRQVCSAQERASMPGLLDAGEVARLESTEASSFDVLFLELMTRHHAGAVAMADAQLRGGSDPRLRIMAQAIRHEQQGEIALMHGVSGGGAVSAAFRNMFADNLNPADTSGVGTTAATRLSH